MSLKSAPAIVLSSSLSHGVVGVVHELFNWTPTMLAQHGVYVFVYFSGDQLRARTKCLLMQIHQPSVALVRVTAFDETRCWRLAESCELDHLAHVYRTQRSQRGKL